MTASGQSAAEDGRPQAAPLVRLSTHDDAGAIARLVIEFGAGSGLSTAAAEGFIRRHLEQLAAGILLAVEPGGAEQGRIVGFLAWSTRLDLYAAAPMGMIEDFFVTPSSRGRGAGRDLLRRAVDTFRAAGCTSAEVVTGPENAAARHLYVDAGLDQELICLQGPVTANAQPAAGMHQPLGT
jgi:GNAT superfamily N-acetyltransferase